MIALCREHADKADNDAFTVEQLRNLKVDATLDKASVKGSFDWMRSKLITLVGGNVFGYVRSIVHINGRDCLSVRRDDDGYLVLNMRLPSAEGDLRARIEQNYWTVLRNVEEIICPPGGRVLDVRYPDGDRTKVEFIKPTSPDDLTKRHPGLFAKGLLPRSYAEAQEYPITLLEVVHTSPSTGIVFGPTGTSMSGFGLQCCVIESITAPVFDLTLDERRAQRFFRHKRPSYAS